MPLTIALVWDKNALLQRRLMFSASLFFILATTRKAEACGTSTHINIAHEALEYFACGNSGHKIGDFAQLLKHNQDAFIAGNPYPDAMYPGLCFGGHYHDVAEDTHWAPFLNASINYVRSTYPQPWSKETEKLVAFIFGFVSHQVADINWHSLGVEHGFLQTMGYMNFHAKYDSAHTVGDVGGDMISQLERDDAPISTMHWYVPAKDLTKIYRLFYGHDKISETVIRDCSLLLYVEWLAEKTAGAKLTPFFAGKSPFLVEQLHSYYLGGIHDMAAWTVSLWNSTAWMFEHGTETCHIPKNTLFISCKKQRAGGKEIQRKQRSISRRKTLFRGRLSSEDVLVESVGRGFYFRPSPKILQLLQEKQLEKKSPNRATYELFKSFAKTFKVKSLLTTHDSYAEFGSSIVRWRISRRFDFVVVGAPYAGLLRRPSTGKVYVIPAADIIGASEETLQFAEDVAYRVLVGPEPMSRFGAALEVLDFNCDGIKDLVVSGPSSGALSLMYSGAVFVYFGRDDGFSVTPDIIVRGSGKHSNFGYSLSNFDVNDDECGDLLISSPFAPGGGEQRGTVWIFYGKRSLKHGKVLGENSANLVVSGHFDYQWFGHAVVACKIDNELLIAIGSPGSRKCANTDCDFSTKDVQEIGRVYLYRIEPGTGLQLLGTINGTGEFDKLGFSLAIGDPYGKGEKYVLAVGAPSGSTSGRFVGLPVHYSQSGNVFLYDLRSLMQAMKKRQGWKESYVAKFSGDRNFGRFGWNIYFSPVSGSLFDDFFIGHPFRSKDITGEFYGGEEGALYYFSGGATFPKGDVTEGCGILGDTPCPWKKASSYSYGNEVGARLGTTVITTTDTSLVLLGVPRSSDGAFHVVAVQIFKD